MPHIKAQEFGDAGIIRRFCDNQACGKQITLMFKGRNGEYCSNNCLKTEKENKTMTSNDTETNDSPISNGTAAAPAKSKRATAKAVAKATKTTAKAVKKAVKKATNSEAKAPAAARQSSADTSTIHVKKSEHEYSGKRGKALDLLLKDGQTVGAYKKAMEKKEEFGTGNYAGWALGVAQKEGLAIVKAAA